MEQRIGSGGMGRWRRAAENESHKPQGPAKGPSPSRGQDSLILAEAPLGEVAGPGWALFVGPFHAGALPVTGQATAECIPAKTYA